MLGGSSDSPVALRDDSLGVSLEETPRHVQVRGDDEGYYCSLKGDWLQQLELDGQGKPTVHSLSLAHRPVIVRNPAIIIQPASILEDDQ